MKKSNINTQFNSNEFYLMLSGLDKIKYESFDTYLSHRSLQGDTYKGMEQFYHAIIRGIGLALLSTMTFIPLLEELAK